MFDYQLMLSCIVGGAWPSGPRPNETRELSASSEDPERDNPLKKKAPSCLNIPAIETIRPKLGRSDYLSLLDMSPFTRTGGAPTPVLGCIAHLADKRLSVRKLRSQMRPCSFGYRGDGNSMKRARRGGAWGKRLSHLVQFRLNGCKIM